MLTSPREMLNEAMERAPAAMEMIESSELTKFRRATSDRLRKPVYRRALNET
jgi:hypothetical protein